MGIAAHCNGVCVLHMGPTSQWLVQIQEGYITLLHNLFWQQRWKLRGIKEQSQDSTTPTENWAEAGQACGDLWQDVALAGALMSITSLGDPSS